MRKLLKQSHARLLDAANLIDQSLDLISHTVKAAHHTADFVIAPHGESRLEISALKVGQDRVGQHDAFTKGSEENEHRETDSEENGYDERTKGPEKDVRQSTSGPARGSSHIDVQILCGLAGEPNQLLKSRFSRLCRERRLRDRARIVGAFGSLRFPPVKRERLSLRKNHLSVGIDDREMVILSARVGLDDFGERFSSILGIDTINQARVEG